MTAASTFEIASRDELWLRGALVESRLVHGEARQRGNIIDAGDARDPYLVDLCEQAMDAARSIPAGFRDARVRLVARATREDGVEVVETTITVGIEGISVVTTPATALIDYDLLRAAQETRATVKGALPIVWRNGSAAVLLHEAIGHAAEHDAVPVPWPSWLSVEAPLVFRRASFRDVPLPRMRHVTARQNGAPFVVPETRIEVQLIAGGAYDPITDVVTINVAASTAGPFTIRRTRAEIAVSLLGATGELIRYPGVICSREGQELYVASYAPVVLTEPLT